MKTLTTTELRKKIYKVIDSVIETGIPVEIEKNGETVIISKNKPTDKLNNLKKRNILGQNTSFKDIPKIKTFDIDSEWKEKENLN